jgi:hypothetical protein
VVLSSQATSSGIAPTGTVTFFVDGMAFPSQGSPLVVHCGDSVTWCIQAFGDLSVSASGTHAVSATYNGDSNYAPSSTSSATISALYSTTMSMMASTSSPMPGATVTLTAVVDSPSKNPAVSGPVTFFYTTRFAGTPTAIPGMPTLTQTTDAQGNAALQAVLSFVPASNLETVFASFTGDSAHQSSTSNNEITIAVAGNDFSLVVGSAPLMMPAGSQGVTSLEIDAESGYSDTATFIASGLPREATAAFTPPSITGSGQASIQVSTQAPHDLASETASRATLAATIRMYGAGFWAAGLGIASEVLTVAVGSILGVLFFRIRMWRRFRRRRLLRSWHTEGQLHHYDHGYEHERTITHCYVPAGYSLTDGLGLRCNVRDS